MGVHLPHTLRARLLGGDGSRVDARLLGSSAPEVFGVWRVVRGRFAIFVPEQADLPPCLATVSLGLEPGPCRFVALLSPAGPHLWRVLAQDLLDNRAALRVPVRLQGSLTADGDAAPVPVEVSDLSPAGVGFRCRTPLTLGPAHDLRLEGDWGERVGPLRLHLVRELPGPRGFDYGARLSGDPAALSRLYPLLWALKGERHTPGAARVPVPEMAWGPPA